MDLFHNLIDASLPHSACGHGVLQKIHGGVLVSFMEVFREGLLAELQIEVAVLMLAFTCFLQSYFSLLDFIIDVLNVCALLTKPTMRSLHLLLPVGTHLVFRSQQ